MQFRKMLLTTAVSLAALVVPTVTYGQAYGQVTVETLNLRSEPTTEAMNLGQLDQSDEVEVVDRVNEEWLEITTASGKSAYVFADYVRILDAEGTIKGQGVRLRDYPDVSDSEVFETLYTGDKVVVEYTVGDWCKVIAKGKQGFVSNEFIEAEFMSEVPVKDLDDIERVEQVVVQTQTTQSVKSQSKSTQSAPQTTPAPVKQSSNTGLGDAIVQDAKQFLGGRYVYGGNSLTNGVDCSGFTQQIMRRHGISISRTSRSQYANDGYKVSSDSLQKGDLLFYGYNGAVSHVAIYIGSGQVIHANTSSTGIIISGAFDVGKPYIGAKRVF